MSGTEAALLEDYAMLITDGVESRRVPFDRSTVAGAVGVPGGWLVALTSLDSFDRSLALVDAAGTVISTRPVLNEGSPAMAYGPGNRVLLTSNVRDDRVRFTITDATGIVVNYGGGLFESDRTNPGVTTDGTSFFVGAHGNLARIAADGTVQLITGFPFASTEGNPSVRLVWGANHGWYFVRTGVNQYAAQRFDVAGMPAGSPLTLNLGFEVSDVLAEGDDILLLRFEGGEELAPKKLSLIRVTPEGSVGASREIGVGVRGAHAARRGSEVLVSWVTASSTHLATVTP